MPDREITVGELVALLATDTLPATLPDADGAKSTFNVTDCPGLRDIPVEAPLALKPAPEILTFETDTFELPELVSVTGKVLAAPALTFPKFKLVGAALSRYVAGLTVSVAALLVAVPAELLTTTVNSAPLSAEVAAGVV